MSRSILACLLLAATCAPAPERPPDLLLVVIDTLRADHLSAHGYHRPTSPALDGLAASGALFLDAVAQSSWTLPSMASMLTGRRLFVNAHRLPEDVPSLAERLREAGYETVAFVANAAVSHRGGYDRGFDAYLTREDTGGITWQARDLEAAFGAWLDAHPPGDHPRFYYLHYLDPHFPYDGSRDTELAGEARLSNHVLDAWVARVQAATEDAPLRSGFDADRRHILDQIDGYDREIAATDASLARVLARLGDRPRLTCVASDHGEGLWDHPHHARIVARLPSDQQTLRRVFFRDHSYHLFGELIQTPLVLAGVGVPAGRRVEAPVENVDIVPTFLRAAGLPPDPSLDGRALQDVLAGAGREPPFRFSHANEGTAVLMNGGPYKLVFPTDTGFSFGMDIQLYHLGRDPHERINLADSEVNVLRRLLGVREQAARSFDLFDDGDLGGTDPDSQRVLQELGYLGR